MAFSQIHEALDVVVGNRKWGGNGRQPVSGKRAEPLTEASSGPRQKALNPARGFRQQHWVASGKDDPEYVVLLTLSSGSTLRGLGMEVVLVLLS